MLYRANNDTKQICLRIKQNGLDCCCDKIKLKLAPLVCEQAPQYQYEYTPCDGVKTIEIKREPPLTLVYDMFDRDEQGNVCFLLDSQFSDLVCGRYNATVEACGCDIYQFQIDKRETSKVSVVNVDSRNNCCEGKYGC